MKKIVMLAILLMLVATTVSASSLNGDYKGNPIVKLKSNGALVDAGEVPAMIYDGKTMVPIAALRNLGANVSWDQNTYSVDVKLPSTQPTTTNDNLANTIIGFNERAKEFNASNVQLVFNDLGGYIKVDLNVTGNDEVDMQNIISLSGFVYKSLAPQIFVNLINNNVVTGFFDIRQVHVENYNNDKLNIEEFVKTWIWTPASGNTQKTPVYSSKPTAGGASDKVTLKSPHKLYSNDGKTYLGKLTTNEYDTDSIYNEYGTYGSKYSTTSIMNDYGTYGSRYSSESAFNDLATDPPIILDKDGKSVGYLTTNTSIKDGISPIGLKQFLADNGY
jgi:hypothetical protein